MLGQAQRKPRRLSVTVLRNIEKIIIIIIIINTVFIRRQYVVYVGNHLTNRRKLGEMVGRGF